MTHADPRDLLARAAGLAPTALDRPDPAGAARRRSRTRGAATALAVAACAAGVVAFTASLPTTDGERLAQAPSAPAEPPAASPPAPPVTRYKVSYATEEALNDPDRAAKLGGCLGLAGVDSQVTQFSNPPQHLVAVTGPEQARAFEGCIASLDGLVLRPDSSAVDTGSGPGRIVAVPFRVSSVSPDRRTVYVLAVTSPCAGPQPPRVSETPAGLLVEALFREPESCRASLQTSVVAVPLPRPLRAGETVAGECLADPGTAEGRQCPDLPPGGG